VKRGYSILLLLLATVCISCAKPAPMQPVEVKPTYTQHFVTAHFKADSQLNLYDGQAHALHVCVYQLSDPNAFNMLSENEMGIAKLMGCDRPDIVTTIQGIANAKRYIMQPADDKTFELDRAEGAKYVGIVAGYYTLQHNNAVMLYKIPVVEQQAKNGLVMILQQPLNIELYLGPQSLQELGGRR
jgi:type VI secretion system VasD/TssJ family lipoprotein